jgi:aconitase A
MGMLPGHTSTHGAFGSLAFGIGTSEVEHVLVGDMVLLAVAHPHPVVHFVRLERTPRPLRTCVAPKFSFKQAHLINVNKRI